MDFWVRQAKVAGSVSQIRSIVQTTSYIFRFRCNNTVCDIMNYRNVSTKLGTNQINHHTSISSFLFFPLKKKKFVVIQFQHYFQLAKITSQQFLQKEHTLTLSRFIILQNHLFLIFTIFKSIIRRWLCLAAVCY